MPISVAMLSELTSGGREDKVSHLRDEVRKEVDRLINRIDEVTAVQRVVLDETSPRDLLNVMRNNHTDSISSLLLRE